MLCLANNLLHPIRSTTQIWVVTRHQYGISPRVPLTLFRGQTSGGAAKCQPFSLFVNFQVFESVLRKDSIWCVGFSAYASEAKWSTKIRLYSSYI